MPQAERRATPRRRRLVTIAAWSALACCVSVPMLSVGVATAHPAAVAQSGGASGPDDPGTPADPDQVRDDVREVMGREEFSYEKSWSDRFGEWLAKQLERLFPDSGPVSGGSFGGGIGQVIAYAIILLALVGVAAAVVYVVVRRVSRVEVEDTPPTETEIEHRRTASAWQSDAVAHEAAGEWKEAIRARYRELVRTLTDRRQLPDVPGRTTRELRVDLGVTTPSAEDDFDTASLLFELPWYADVPTGAEENARFRAAAAAVLAAPTQESFEVGVVPGSSADEDVVEVTV